MPKHVYLTKYFRSRSSNQSDLSQRYGSYAFKSRHSLKSPLLRGGGGGRPDRSGRPPNPPPPFPKGLIIGVCGRRGFGNAIFVISQIHIDEIAAAANAVFYVDPDLQEELKEKRPYLFYEEFNNEFRELKAWRVTEHTGWTCKPDGTRKLENTKSYCYRFTPNWLESALSFKTNHTYASIDESFEANCLLGKARAEGFVPLFHWQPRGHVDVGSRITPPRLPDGYLLDNRTWRSHGNVVAKCVPSILDVLLNPSRWGDNEYARYFSRRGKP
ncbi:MAG TPA: hypothetical protein EYP19_05315 [Desulfobacterales bacterium]|nr:hypothetical protein [Desulfobacterales bacterium]